MWNDIRTYGYSVVAEVESDRVTITQQKGWEESGDWEACTADVGQEVAGAGLALGDVCFETDTYFEHADGSTTYVLDLIPIQRTAQPCPVEIDRDRVWTIEEIEALKTRDES